MTAVAAFKLTSPVSQTAAPFMIGHPFKRGDIPAGQYAEVDLSNFTVVPLKYWLDGSLKWAAIMGRSPLTANTAKQINIVKRSTAPLTGTVLTAVDIQTAAPTASIQFGSFGTVSLTPLLGASPLEVWYSTKECVVCSYAAKCGSDPSLWAEFIVKLHVTGQVEVNAVAHNGYLNGTEFVQKDYVPTVTIGGTMVWNNAGAVYHHSTATDWNQVKWIGVDPQVTPQHDTGYFDATGLVPSYWKRNPSQTVLNLYGGMTYVPGANMDFSQYMASPGLQNDIGLLPLWDALWCTSGADPRMYRAVVNHSRAARSYAVCLYDKNTLKPARILDFPNWSVSGANGGSNRDRNSVSNTGLPLTHEKNHAADMGTLAALITADPFHIQTLGHNAMIVYLDSGYNMGLGVNRMIEAEVRGQGWGLRTLSHAAALLPDSKSYQYGAIQQNLDSIAHQLVTKYVTPTFPGKWVGYVDMFSNRNTNGYAANGQKAISTAPWEQNFNAQAVGHAVKMEACSSAGAADLAAIASYMLQGPVWSNGGTSNAEYNFGYSAAYSVQLRSSVVDVTQGFIPVTEISATNGGMVFADTWGYDSSGNISKEDATGTVSYNAANPGTNLLKGESAGSAANPGGYFSNMIPALAVAVDLGQYGAAAAFSRFIGATNFSSQSAAGYDDLPIWGIMPQSYTNVAQNFTPVDSGTGLTVTTPGPSFIWSSTPLIAGSFAWGTIRGVGVPLSSIAPGGSDGTSPLYDAVIAASGTVDPASEVRWASGAAAHGTISTALDGSFLYTGDGAYDTVLFDFWLDGPQTQTAVPVNFGTAPVTTVNAPGANITGTADITGGAATVLSPGAAPGADITGTATIAGGAADNGVVYVPPVVVYPDVFAPGARLVGTADITPGAASGNTPAALVGGTGPRSKSRTFVVSEPQVRWDTSDGTGIFWNMSNPAKPKGIKDPNATIDIPFDWTAWFADGGDAYVSHQILTTGGAVLTESDRQAGVVTAFVTGGGLNQTASVTCRVVSNSTPPRTDDRTVFLRIKDR